MQLLYSLLFVVILFVIPTIAVWQLIRSSINDKERMVAARAFMALHEAARSTRSLSGIDEVCVALRFESTNFRLPNLIAAQRAYQILKSMIFTERDIIVKLALGESPFDNEPVIEKLSQSLRDLSEGCIGNSQKQIDNAILNMFLIPDYGRGSPYLNISDPIPEFNETDLQLMDDLNGCASKLRLLDLAGAWAKINRWRDLRKMAQLSPDLRLSLSILREYIDVTYEPTQAPLDPTRLERASGHIADTIEETIHYLRNHNRFKVVSTIVTFLGAFGN